MSYVLGAVSSESLYLPTDAQVMTFGQVPGFGQALGSSGATGLSQRDFGKVIAGAVAGTVQGNTGIPMTADEVLFRLAMVTDSRVVDKLNWATDKLGEDAIGRGGNLTAIGQDLSKLAKGLREAITGSIIVPIQSAFRTISAGISKLGVDRLLSFVIDNSGIKNVLMELSSKVVDTLKQALGSVIQQLTAIVSQITSVISTITAALPYLGAGLSFLMSFAQTISDWMSRYQGVPGLATDYAGDGLNLYIMFLKWSDQNKGTKYLSEDVVRLISERGGSSITLRDLTRGWVTSFDPIYQEAFVWNKAIPDMYAPIRVLDLGPAIVPGPGSDGKQRQIQGLSWPMFRDALRNTEFQRYVRDKAPSDWMNKPSVIEGIQTSSGSAERTPKDRNKISEMIGCKIFTPPGSWPGAPEVSQEFRTKYCAARKSPGCDTRNLYVPDVCYGGGPDAPVSAYRQSTSGGARMLRLAACYVHGTGACTRGQGKWNPPAGTSKKGMLNAYFDDNNTWYDLGYGAGYDSGPDVIARRTAAGEYHDPFAGRRTDWWGHFDSATGKLSLIPPFEPPFCVFTDEVTLSLGSKDNTADKWKIRDAFAQALKDQRKYEIGTEPSAWLPQISPSPAVVNTPQGVVAIVDSERANARTDPRKALDQSAKRAAAQKAAIKPLGSTIKYKGSFVPQKSMSTGKKVALGVGIATAAGLGVGGYLVYRRRKRVPE